MKKGDIVANAIRLFLFFAFIFGFVLMIGYFRAYDASRLEFEIMQDWSTTKDRLEKSN